MPEFRVSFFKRRGKGIQPGARLVVLIGFILFYFGGGGVDGLE